MMPLIVDGGVEFEEVLQPHPHRGKMPQNPGHVIHVRRGLDGHFFLGNIRRQPLGEIHVETKRGEDVVDDGHGGLPRRLDKAGYNLRVRMPTLPRPTF